MEQKSMFKRILSFVVIFTMLFSSFVILAAPAFAADEVVDSGKYGAGLTIEVSDNDKIVNLSAEEAAEKLTDGDWALDAPAWGGDTSGVVLFQNKNATQANAWGQINLIWNLGDDPEAYNQIRLGLYSSVESMIGYPTEEDVFFSNDGENWVGGYSSDDIGYGETIPTAYATFEEGATAPGTVIGEIKLRNPQTYKYVRIELYFPSSPFTVESGKYTEETAKPMWEFFGLTEIEITSVKTSNVVTDWNPHEYWEGRGGSNGSYAFNNAEDYAASNLVWWKHVSFAPVEGEEGKYTIAGIRNAGENPKLDFPEGGFVWAAWGDAGAGTPGKAALNLFSSMAVGDVYVLTGFDVEGEYVENDATVTKYVDPNAPVNVALGSKYEIVGLAPSGSYPDTDNKELTDGARVNGKYGEPGWVGVILTSGVRAFDVVVTLGDGETVYNIDKIIVNAGAKGTSAGVTEPNFITYYSVDGENWTEFGTYTATDNADVMSVNATMEVATPVEAKYIKVNVSRPLNEGNLMWLGEIEAYGKEAEAEPAFEYPEGYTVVTGETGKWQSDEGDFDFGYKYDVVDDNLVVDVIINDELVKAAADASTGNGVATNVRLWVNYGNAKWDRLYDGYFKGDEIALFSKDAAGTTGTEGTIAFADNVITFTLPLEELAGGNEQFQFTICVSNTDAEGKNNACLYAFCDTFAWSAWDAENAHTIVLPEKPVISVWGSGGTIDVLTDGYTGVGEVTKWEGNESKLYGLSNNLLVKAEYDFTVAIVESTFDAITLYVLDYANGGVMLPESVKFVVNGVTYDTVITPNENGIATIVAELDEAVTASEIKVEVVMGESPYTFAIFNMFTEITVDVAPVEEEYFWKEGEYELDDTGNWNPYFAWGYVFEIDSVNTTSGACTAIFDNATDYVANGPGKWTTQLVLAPVAGEEGVYELIKAYKTTGKNAQGNLDAGNVDFEDGKIVLSVQDSGTRPEKNDDGTLKFPNWEDRAASWGLMNTIGAKLTLDGNTLTVEDKPAEGTKANPGVIEILPGMRGYMGEGLASLTGGAEYYWTTTVPVDGNLNVQFYVIDAEYNGYSVDYSLNGGELLNNYNYDNPGLDDLKAGDVVTIYVKVAADAPAVDVTAMVSLDAVGSMSNPEEITETGDVTTEIAEGNFSGHAYEFVAPADGKVTVTMSEDNTGWFYAVSVVESGIYGDNHYSDDDPIVATETVEVKAGDVVTITVSTYGGMSTEGTVKWTLAFEEVKPEVIELLVSHVNAYNWGTFEAMIISGDGKTVEEVIGQKPHWWIVYTVENIDGKYVATDYLKNSEECYKVKVPTGGFLFYVFDANSAYAAADEGALLNYTFVLGTISLEGVTAIDTTVNAAKVLTVYAPGVEIPEPTPTSKVVNAFNVGHYSEGSEGANGAYIFTDAEKYGDGSGYAWWRHVALAPVEGEEGKYEVTAITKGDGGESGGLDIPEGGFIWVAFEWPEGETSGTYALNVMNSLAVGDFVVFNGIDIENCTTTEDATAEKWVDPDAKENVALNKDYELSGCGNRTSYYADLTDGVATGTLTYNNDDWFGFYCNGTDASVINAPDKLGVVTIDLEKVYVLDSVRVNTFFGNTSGICAPEFIKLEASEDGETYTEVEVKNLEIADSNIVEWVEFTSEEGVKAQYIRLSFKLRTTFVFINEIEAYGEEAEGEPVEKDITVVPNYNFKYAAGNTTILVPWTMGDTLESILDKQYEWFNFAILEWDADAAVYKVVDVKIGTDIKASVDPENGVDFGVLEIPEYGFILGAHNDDTANHEAIAKLEAGDIVYIYGTDLINATIETALTDAVVTTKALDDKTAFAPEIKTEEPVISGWGAGVEVMTDGYNGLGEITGYEGNNDKIYGFGNNLLVKAEYDFTVALDAKNINAITLYALDYANGGVMLPESVKFVVNDKSYDAVITPNENGIATIKAELGEVVSATEIKVEVVMGESPYTFGIFNMFTEIEVTEAKANITQWASGADIDVLTDGYNGLGEITGYEGNGDKLYGLGNDVLFAAPYSFTVTIDEATINAITLYALDYAGGGVMLPDSVKFVVNGKSYDAVITPNENGIATIKAELGEDVTVTEITVEAVMGDSPYTFGIFNMFTELEVTEAVVDPTVGIGDVNGNGEIEMYDYILVKRQIMNTIELTDEQKAVADVNGNGEIEMYDYILIKRHIMGTYVIGE